MKKKTKVMILSVIALVLVTIGITYAYWLVTKSQQGENLITTGCLDITLDGANDITLSNQFPLSDSDGKKLTPYTFTVTNNCKTSVDYQVNLEMLGSESSAIKASAIKVALDEEISLLSEKGQTPITIDGAYESRRIMYGTLAGASEASNEDEVSHSLRMWIDENAPISEMNKTFTSKITVTVGQDIFNPYKEGTLAYSILEQNGGVSSIQAIDRKEEKVIESVSLGEYDYGKEYFFGTEYEYNEKLGTYALDGVIVEATIEDCVNGVKQCGKYTLLDEYYDESFVKDYIYEITEYYLDLGLGCDGDWCAERVMKANKISHKIEFSNWPGTGVYKAIDDLGTSYYYSGDVTNNYVKFGTYSKDYTISYTEGLFEPTTVTVGEIKIGDPMYWRIVRINGDGTIRLVYDGIEKTENSAEDVSVIPFDTNINAWYETNLKTNHEKYIADSIFCDDREEAGTVSGGFGAHVYYATAGRLDTQNPALTCTNKADRYTVNDVVNGNGQLTNPVGELTTDEVYMAGITSKTDSNTDNYLQSSLGYMLKSKFYHSIFGDEDNYGYCVLDGKIDVDYGDKLTGVRPVINLKADVKFTGDGSFATPYEIVMN